MVLSDCKWCKRSVLSSEIGDKSAFYLESTNEYIHEICLYEKLKECNKYHENLTPELESIFNEIYNSKEFKHLRDKIKNDFNYHGFAGTLETVHRDMYYILQYKRDGFDSTELWSLDYTIAKFIYPRLKKFNDGISIPSNLTKEKWMSILDEMIYSFEMICDEKQDCEFDKDIASKINNGLKLFAEYYRHLWN